MTDEHARERKTHNIGWKTERCRVRESLGRILDTTSLARSKKVCLDRELVSYTSTPRDPTRTKGTLYL
jgi:hypothetical protein